MQNIKSLFFASIVLLFASHQGVCANESSALSRLFSIDNPYQSGPMFELGLGASHQGESYPDLSSTWSLNYRLNPRHLVGYEIYFAGIDNDSHFFHQLQYRYDLAKYKYFSYSLMGSLGTEVYNSSEILLKPNYHYRPAVGFKNRVGLNVWYTGFHITPGVFFSSYGITTSLQAGFSFGVQ